MSSVSRWVYTNDATVWKVGPKDGINGGTIWAAPFVIKCTWTAESKVVTDNNGHEFVSTCAFFHEDKRVGHGDRIRQGIHQAPNPITLGGTNTIKAHTDWDMSFFGKKDKAMPDFKSVT